MPWNLFRVFTRSYLLSSQCLPDREVRVTHAFGPLLCLLCLSSTYTHGTLVLYWWVLISDTDVSCWINENLSMRKQIQPTKAISKGRFHLAQQPAQHCFCIFWSVERGVSADGALTQAAVTRKAGVMNATCCTSKFTSAGGTRTSAGHRAFVQLSFQTISRLDMIFEYYTPSVFTAYVTLEIPREFLKPPK